MDAPRLLKIAPMARLRFDKVGGGHMLLSPERGLSLSPTATLVVQLCDGTRTATDIVTKCVETHGESDPTLIAKDVRALLDELLGRGLVVEGPAR